MKRDSVSYLTTGVESWKRAGARLRARAEAGLQAEREKREDRKATQSSVGKSSLSFGEHFADACSTEIESQAGTSAHGV